MCSDIRQQGKDTIAYFVRDPTLCDVIDDVIYTVSRTEEEYMDIVYEFLTDILEPNPTPDTIRRTLYRISKNKTLWNHPRYDTIRNDIEEQDNFSSRPIEVEEGVMECFKCGSKRTISFQKQTRSADEGFTTFVQCVQCKSRWKNSN